MNHFDIWQWTDFVRGLGGAALRSDMETHLSSGCPRCRTTVDTLHKVVMTARAEPHYEPPTHAIRYATALFPPAPEKLSLPRLIARLVHDSIREPLPAGMRAQDRSSRRALFEATGFHLDLQLERAPTSGLITLVGQLVNPHQPLMTTAYVPVLLMEGDSVVASTICNEFGEFRLEYEPRRKLRLYIPLREAGKRIEVSLGRLTLGAAHRARVAHAARTSSKRKALQK